MRSGANQHPEDTVLQFLTDLVYQGGTAISTHLQITQQSVADMTVKVATGRGYIKGSSSNAYPVRLTATENITIGANGSGNPRIDAVGLYIDLSADASAPGDGTGVVKTFCVAGTPAGSPSAPSNGDISTAIGGSNPFLRLANVAVSSGATSIVTANITDMRVPVSWFFNNQTFAEQASNPSTPASGYGVSFFTTNGLPAYVGDDGIVRPLGEDAVKTLSDGATVTIDASDLYKIYSVVFGGNRTLALTNAYSGKRFLFHAGQDGTGSRIPTWFNKASTFATGDVNTGTEVITVARNIPTGTPLKFSSTTTLPAGLSAATKYYAINASSTTIKVASTLALAQAGTAIDLTSTGSGTHTVTTEIAWADDTEPTLQTGKYQSDTFGIIVKDATNGIYLGYIVGQGFPTQ